MDGKKFFKACFIGKGQKIRTVDIHALFGQFLHTVPKTRFKAGFNPQCTNRVVITRTKCGFFTVVLFYLGSFFTAGVFFYFGTVPKTHSEVGFHAQYYKLKKFIFRNPMQSHVPIATWSLENCLIMKFLLLLSNTTNFKFLKTLTKIEFGK